jgi:hypothetical protein
MSRDGNGNYTRVPGSGYPNGTTADGPEVDAEMNDIATALTQSLSKDGQTVPTANLPMGGYRHTNVDDAAARTDYARADQVQDCAFATLSSVSGADTITATAPISMTAYVAGQEFSFVSAGANTTAVTLNINGIGAKDVTKRGTTALAAGDIPSGAVVVVVYDGTRFQLINSTGSGSITASGYTQSTSRILGRATASTGAIEELTLTQALDLVGSAAQGDVLYRDASAWARLGAGTSGQLLQTGGAGANPSWVSSPVRTLVAPTTSNNVAAIDIISIPATARGVEIELAFVAPVSDNVDFLLLTSTDNGSTFDNSAGNYQYANTVNTVGGSIAANNSASATSVLIAQAMGNAVNENGSGRIRLHFPGDAQYCCAEWEFTYRNQSSGTLVKVNGGGFRLATADVNAVRMLFSSGNVNTCKYSVIYW